MAETGNHVTDDVTHDVTHDVMDYVMNTAAGPARDADVNVNATGE